MIKIMAINAGSSSLKFQLLNMSKKTVCAEGVFERIGINNGHFTIKFKGKKNKINQDFPTHQEAITLLLEKLISEKIVKSLTEIIGCGHRVVHGGDIFPDSVIINEEILKQIEKLAPLAPLHNPANVMGIKVFQKALPQVQHVAVFDTSFHQTMVKKVFLYPLPMEYYTKHKVRKYGFHGTSHKFIAQKLIKTEGTKNLKIINLHLGNGASICAIKNGKSIDTSMGFTPLGGLMMGTRSGDIDPAIITYIMEKEQISAYQFINILNKKSGMLGVSTVSSDARDIEDLYTQRDPRGIITEELYVKRIGDYIGSYIIALGGVDIISFTAGLGENAIYLRQRIISYISEATGAKIDLKKNNTQGEFQLISTFESKIRLYVVPTNEELMIALDTVRLLGLK